MLQQQAEWLMSLTRDYDEIILVFDTYRDRSLKSATRNKSITYKLCLIAYKAIHNSMPDYITNFCTSAADNRLRSSAKNLLQVPRSSTKFGDCSFSVAGPAAWNSLPDHVKNASSL